MPWYVFTCTECGTDNRVFDTRNLSVGDDAVIFCGNDGDFNVQMVKIVEEVNEK